MGPRAFLATPPSQAPPTREGVQGAPRPRPTGFLHLIIWLHLSFVCFKSLLCFLHLRVLLY